MREIVCKSVIGGRLSEDSLLCDWVSDNFPVYTASEQHTEGEKVKNRKKEKEKKSILIKDTTKEEREQIIRESMDCTGGCENCSSCWLGGGSPWDIYQDYIDGRREIREINAEYMEQYHQGRNII